MFSLRASARGVIVQLKAYLLQATLRLLRESVRKMSQYYHYLVWLSIHVMLEP